LAVQISSGKICAVFGPHAGSVADITALREGFAVVQQSDNEPIEVVLADKGYQGESRCLTPFKGSNLSPEEDAFNEVVASVRQLVECVIQRTKIFGVCGPKGRFRCEREKHQICFRVVCNICNISMQREPVWLNRNWYLL
jgi:hypothetical protein